jgi:hypothetical protein
MAIRRENTIRLLYNGVTQIRGLGPSGRRVSLVEETCKICEYDRMILHEHIYPEDRPDLEWACNNPNCPDYHNDRLGYRRD